MVTYTTRRDAIANRNVALRGIRAAGGGQANCSSDSYDGAFTLNDAWNPGTRKLGASGPVP